MRLSAMAYAKNCPGNAMTHAAVAAISNVLVALIGFASHRASLCTVRAVGEIISEGKLVDLDRQEKAPLELALRALKTGIEKLHDGPEVAHVVLNRRAS